MKNECPACGAVYSVTQQHVGRRIACKKCGAALVVEAGGIELAGAPRPADIPPTYAEGIAPPPAQRAQPLPPFTPAIDNDDEPPPRPRPRSQGGSALLDFLLFRRMMTPVLIQVVFWVGVASCLFSGLSTLLVAVLDRRDGWSLLLALFLAAGQMILGPIFLRVSCEIVMVVFRIYETLREIKDSAQKQSEPEA